VTFFNGDATAIPVTSTINLALSDITIANGGIVAVGGPGQFAGEIWRGGGRSARRSHRDDR
jgi:hypothetical protein